MSSSRSALAKLAFFAAITATSAAAHAGATWSLDSTSPVPIPCSGAVGTIGGSVSCNGNADAGGVKATVTAWSTTGNTGTTFATAALGSWDGSGFGVSGNGESTANPQHSMDNNGATDAILIKFDKSVSLNAFTIGWSSGDADISVLRYTGNGDALAALQGKTTTGLVAAGNGWSLVKSFNLTAAGDTDITATIGGDASSSWWLISAYNANYGENLNNTSSDYVKLLSVASNATIPRTGTPEPGSIALAGVALAAMFGVNRRRNKKARAAA